MAADISGDGSLDVKEFLSFSHPEEDPAMRPHVLAQVIFLAKSTPHIFWSGLEGEGHWWRRGVEFPRVCWWSRSGQGQGVADFRKGKVGEIFFFQEHHFPPKIWFGVGQEWRFQLEHRRDLGLDHSQQRGDCYWRGKFVSFFLLWKLSWFTFVEYLKNRWITCSLEQMRMGMNSLRLRRFCILKNLINIDLISSYSSLCVLPLNKRDFFRFWTTMICLWDLRQQTMEITCTIFTSGEHDKTMTMFMFIFEFNI